MLRGRRAATRRRTLGPPGDREIFYGNQRFDQIVRNTGAPRDRLAARLRTREEAGVVERRAYSERPLRYEYQLTEAGPDLAPVMRALPAWGDRWAVDAPPVAFRHRGGARLRARRRARPRSDVDVPDLR